MQALWTIFRLQKKMKISTSNRMVSSAINDKESFI